MFVKDGDDLAILLQFRRVEDGCARVVLHGSVVWLWPDEAHLMLAAMERGETVFELHTKDRPYRPGWPSTARRLEA